MGIDMIRKRDGREVPFDQDKIEQAIFASFQASGSARGHETSRKLTEEVVRQLENNENISAIPSVEQVQDTVEQVLMRNGFTRTAKSYILYRAERSRVREMNSRLMRTFGDIVFKDASESDIKRENANINGDTATIMRKRILFFISVSSSIESSNRFIKAVTSSCGRFQFSVEKVYKVRYLTPRRAASSIILCTVSAPAW